MLRFAFGSLLCTWLGCASSMHVADAQLYKLPEGCQQAPTTVDIPVLATTTTESWELRVCARQAFSGAYEITYPGRGSMAGLTSTSRFGQEGLASDRCTARAGEWVDSGVIAPAASGGAGGAADGSAGAASSAPSPLVLVTRGAAANVTCESMGLVEVPIARYAMTCDKGPCWPKGARIRMRFWPDPPADFTQAVLVVLQHQPDDAAAYKREHDEFIAEIEADGDAERTVVPREDPVPPPLPRAETPPAPPNAHARWVPGYWASAATGWRWVPGFYRAEAGDTSVAAGAQGAWRFDTRLEVHIWIPVIAP